MLIHLSFNLTNQTKAFWHSYISKPSTSLHHVSQFFARYGFHLRKLLSSNLQPSNAHESKQTLSVLGHLSISTAASIASYELVNLWTLIPFILIIKKMRLPKGYKFRKYKRLLDSSPPLGHKEHLQSIQKSWSK